MIDIDIPGLGPISIKYLASDFSGTLSVDGIVSSDVKNRLNQLAKSIEIHILTADTHGKAAEEMTDIDCHLHLLENNGESHDIQKKKYIERLGAENVIAFGNGRNDRLMLKKAIIGISVCLVEGCATEAVLSSDITVDSTESAIDLLLFPNRLKATLRI